MTTTEFKEALLETYKRGDLDKILNTKDKDYLDKSRAYLRREKKAIKQLKAALDDMTERGVNIIDMPFIILLYGIDSAEVLKNIIIYMTEKEGGRQ